ncbi:L-aspartate oxidase [Anaerosolibacter carboniphilus]|uniref:L-aspartate oxidase n=1 Tax=Anaerosolibacter carboniphilus TaxID=1417629 RepID=A0A841KXR1_9FIRM|nr:L-aspartate oxidase [Anaerosolibacter carboniphilus]MBB6218424.1 L-aspartate oxidase [Anaerosolibacter carboniphilus]
MNENVSTKEPEDAVKSDVVVIGTGIAGLYTALNISERYTVTILSKAALETNNSNLAQGGIAACVSPSDDFESHYEDTVKAGAYHNDQKHTRILIEEAPVNIGKLLQYGVNLDRDEEGKLLVTREGGHSKRRVLHAKDATGREIIRGMGEEIHRRQNIRLMEHVCATWLMVSPKGVIGLLAIDKDGQQAIYQSNCIVMATGGIGQVYKNTTNPSVATGDGIAMAYEAGTEIRDMEFIQFHPTAMYTDTPGQKFLISEAVRGEGAILRNIHGEAFMEKYHELEDLAPRDIVARSIFAEMIKTGQSHVYLDITHKGSEFIQHRFPTIYNHCLKEGIDMTKEWIPVAPAEHYVMGGILTDDYGRTNLKGLYACGECACTGVHGANRLASNSLLEGLVFGKRVAEDINKILSEDQSNEAPLIGRIGAEKTKTNSPIDISALKNRLKETMDRHVSIIRTEKGLEQARGEVEEIRKTLEGSQENSIPYHELKNMTTVAWLIIESAIKRKESLGGHYRQDEMEG